MNHTNTTTLAVTHTLPNTALHTHVESAMQLTPKSLNKLMVLPVLMTGLHVRPCLEHVAVQESPTAPRKYRGRSHRHRRSTVEYEPEQGTVAGVFVLFKLPPNQSTSS